MDADYSDGSCGGCQAAPGHGHRSGCPVVGRRLQASGVPVDEMGFRLRPELESETAERVRIAMAPVDDHA